MMALAKIYRRLKRFKVKELSIDHCGLSTTTKIEGLEKYQQLQVLRLNGNALSFFSGGNITKTLELLYLQDNQIQSIEDLNFPHLKHLDLTNNRLSSLPSLNLPSLIELNLEGNNLSSLSVTSLPKSLKILNLKNNRLTNPASLLPILAQIHNLEELDLSLNPLCSLVSDSQILQSLPNLKNLNGQSVDPTLGSKLGPVKRSYKLKYERLTHHPSVKHLQLPNTSLPDHIDLISLSESFSPQNWPVWDQGELGSCTAFAILSTLHYYDPTVQPSTLFQYYNERLQDGDIDSDNGSTITQATQCLIKYGYCSVDSWPYITTKFSIAPPQSCYDQAVQNLEGQNPQFEILDPSPSSIMSCLSRNCPVILGISVYESFESDKVAKTGMVPMPKPDEQLLGGHAVSIVGYDTKTKRWKVRNSWGPNWGDKGYFYLPFEYITESQLASDLWAYKVGFVVPKSTEAAYAIRPTAPSLSLNLQPGSPRHIIETSTPECEGRVVNTKPKRMISILTIDESTIKHGIEETIASLPSAQSVITTVIGVLTLIQQIMETILAATNGGSAAALSLDQKGQLIGQCASMVIDSLVEKGIINTNLAVRTKSGIQSLSLPKTAKKVRWWQSKKAPQIGMVDSSFGLLVSS